MKKINIAKLKWDPWKSPKGTVEQAGKDISGALGDVRYGWPQKGHPFNLELVKVAPGKAACPFHAHGSQWELYVIVSGTGTGKPTDPAKARRVKATAPNTPLYVGSGVTIETVDQFRDVADGFIVGTHFKHHGKVDQPVDGERVRAFVQRVRG